MNESLMFQSLLVALILLACVAYTARRLWKRFTLKRSDDVHCAGCPLAETCDHRHNHATCQHEKCCCS